MLLMGTTPAEGKGPVHATRLGALRRPRRSRTPPERHPGRPGTRLLPRGRGRVARHHRRGRLLRPALHEGPGRPRPGRGHAQAAGGADPHGRLRGVPAAGAGRGDAVQRGRPARHQHGRTRHRPRPGQRAAPGRLRPQPDQRRVAVRVRPGPGRPAGPDHRVRAHRAGDRVPAERVRGRLGHPGGPARPDRAAGGAPDRGPAPAAAERRRHVRHRPAHPADRGHDRRPRTRAAAGRRAAGQRGPRQAGRDGRAGGRAGNREDPRGARRDRAGAAAPRSSALAPARGADLAARRRGQLGVLPARGPADGRAAQPLPGGPAAGEHRQAGSRPRPARRNGRRWPAGSRGRRTRRCGRGRARRSDRRRGRWTAGARW